MSRRKNSYVTSARLFSGALILCTVVIVAEFLVLKYARDTYQQSRAGYSKQVQFTFETLSNREWLAGHSQFYADLAENGTVGVPDKLVWVDFLAPLYRSIPVDDYQFEISPMSGHALKEDLMLETADISIYGNLLHDGMLANLLNYISNNAPGGWYYQSMEVVRNREPGLSGQSAADSDLQRSSLEFVLRLTWVVIVDKAANGAQT